MDGAFSVQNFDGTSGAIVRNVAILVFFLLAATTRWYPSLANALHAEVIACRDGIKLISGWNVDQVIVVNDSPTLVNLWHSRGSQLSEIAAILMEIQELSLLFSSFDVVHVRRMANSVAHLCAKQSLPN